MIPRATCAVVRVIVGQRHHASGAASNHPFVPVGRMPALVQLSHMTPTAASAAAMPQISPMAA